MGVRAYVCVCVRTEGLKESYVWADLPGFFSSVVCAESLPRVQNDYLLMSCLENISHSRSTMREDSTSLAGETPLTESGKRVLKDKAGLLAMASKRVRCYPSLPTTESDSYGER